MNPPDTTRGFYAVKYDTGYIHRRVDTVPVPQPGQIMDTLSAHEDGLVITTVFGETLMVRPSDRFYVAPEPPPKPVKTAFDSIQPHAELEPLLPGPSMAEKFSTMLAVHKPVQEQQYPWNGACFALTFGFAVMATLLFFHRIHEHYNRSAAAVRSNRVAGQLPRTEN